MTVSSTKLSVEPPWSNQLTDYDKVHFELYMRLLSATREFVPDAVICAQLLDIHAGIELEHAQEWLSNHLRRALWLTNEGRDLLFAEDRTLKHLDP